MRLYEITSSIVILLTIVLIIMSILLVGCLLNEVLGPHEYIKLRADQWKCTKQVSIFNGRAHSNHCVQYEPSK